MSKSDNSYIAEKVIHASDINAVYASQGYGNNANLILCFILSTGDVHCQLSYVRKTRSR